MKHLIATTTTKSYMLQRLNSLYKRLRAFMQMLSIGLLMLIGACVKEASQKPVNDSTPAEATKIEWVEWRYPDALLMPGDLADLPEEKQKLVADAAGVLLDKQFTNQFDGFEGMVFSFRPLSEPRRYPKEAHPGSTQILPDRLMSTVGGIKLPPPHPVSYSFSPELIAVAVTRGPSGEPDKALIFSAFLGALYQDETMSKHLKLNPNPRHEPPDDAWILVSAYKVEPLVQDSDCYYKLTREFETRQVPLVWLTGKIAELADYPHGPLGPLSREYN